MKIKYLSVRTMVTCILFVVNIQLKKFVKYILIEVRTFSLPFKIFYIL